jgi:hypothetical protein
LLNVRPPIPPTASTWIEGTPAGTVNGFDPDVNVTEQDTICPDWPQPGGRAAAEAPAVSTVAPNVTTTHTAVAPARALSKPEANLRAPLNTITITPGLDTWPDGHSRQTRPTLRVEDERRTPLASKKPARSGFSDLRFVLLSDTSDEMRGLIGLTALSSLARVRIYARLTYYERTPSHGFEHGMVKTGTNEYEDQRGRSGARQALDAGEEWVAADPENRSFRIDRVVTYD